MKKTAIKEKMKSGSLIRGLKVLAIVFAIILIYKGIFTNSESSESIEYKYVHTAVNLRKGAGTNHDVIVTLSPGSRVEVIEKSGEWWKVRTSEIDSGYVYQSLLMPDPRPDPKNKLLRKEQLEVIEYKDDPLQKGILSHTYKINDKINGVKLSVDVDIPSRYELEDLKSIAHSIIKKEGNYTRFFFLFWLPGMIKGTGAYASFDYVNNKFVIFVEPTITDATLAKSKPTNSESTNVIGVWVDNLINSTHSIEVTDDKYFDNIAYKDGSKSKRELKKESTSKYIVQDGHNEYYIINAKGDLEVYDDLGIISTYILILPLIGQNYIQVIKSDVNIKFSSSPSSGIITQAKNGDIFKLINEKGDWFEIVMFSGEYRYIHKSFCKKTDYVSSLPESEQFRKTVFLELLNAEDKAYQLADKNYPNDIYQNIDYARSLNDKYKLEVLNKLDLQPPIYSKIILEGVRKKWDK